MDPLLVLGIFVIGAAAGSILTYTRYRGIVNGSRELSKGGSPYTYLPACTQEIFGLDLPDWTVRDTSDPPTPEIGGREGTGKASELLSVNSLQFDQDQEAAR